MAIDNLTRLDLNLLVCLHVLLEKCSVSKTAEHLNLSQSAISKSLARLREVFDDPLLERSGYGMEPTPKARQIKPELATLISDIEKLTAPDSFEPQSSTRRFRLAAVESIHALLFPRFVAEAMLQAPKITIESCNWQAETFDLLQKGELDFAITGKDLHPKDAELTMIPPKGIESEELYQDKLCCLVRSGHPALNQKWDLSGYLSHRHIMTRYGKNERWLLDIRLAEQGEERNIALFVPDFNSAAELCSHTDFILSCPSLFAQKLANNTGLQVLPLPFELPALSYTLFWHENRERDLAHRWLGKLISERCR